MVLVANVQAAKMIEPAEEAFDLPAAPVASERPAVLSWRLDAIDFVRGNQLDALLPESFIERIAVVGFVSNQSSGKFTNESGIQCFFNEGDFMWRSRGHKGRDRKTRAVCHCHDLATLAPLGCSDGSPPFFAITKVPSMKHSDKSKPPRSRTSSTIALSNASSTPERTQCWNRRWHVWYGGYRSGKSCHRAPVFRIQRMPWSTSRSSFQGRPRPSGRLGAGGIRGLSTSHWASVKSIGSSSSRWGSPWESTCNPMYHERVTHEIHL